MRRRATGSAAREQDWEVTEAADGIEALARLATDHPDLILLDLMLPQMNGYEVIEAIRQHKQWRTIPVVVITGVEIDAEGRHRLQGQVERVLQKGLYSRDRLFQEVRTLIGAHGRCLRSCPLRTSRRSPNWSGAGSRKTTTR
jgi:CheY-like chemotaxis protein